jgi:hypothetical protein
MAPQTFVFPSTEVIIAPLSRDEPRSALRGVLDGTWTTQPASTTEFVVSAFDGLLTIPIVGASFLDPAPPTTFPVWLRLASFDQRSPYHVCNKLNHGLFDPKNNFATATVGLSARLPFGAADAVPSYIVMQTMAAFGPNHLQTGSGIGTAISGLLLGTIFCCAAGPRGQLKDDPRPKKEPEPERPIGEGEHLQIDLPIVTTGEATKKAKELTSRPDRLAQILVRQTLSLFKRAGILDELAEQIKKAGLEGIKISIVIRMDNSLHTRFGFSALTTCGANFVGIEIDADTLLEPYADDIMESFWDTLAHELLHAKNCAYKKAKLPLPYGGHDDQPFKDKVKELVKKAKERAAKDKEAWEKAFKDAFGK